MAREYKLETLLSSALACGTYEGTDRALSSHIGTYIHYQTMTEPSLTTLIGDEIQGNRQNRKWATFVDGGDGFFYGIPYDMMLAV